MNLKNKSDKELGILLESTRYKLAHLREDEKDIQIEIIEREKNEK